MTLPMIMMDCKLKCSDSLISCCFLCLQAVKVKTHLLQRGAFSSIPAVMLRRGKGGLIPASFIAANKQIFSWTRCFCRSLLIRGYFRGWKEMEIKTCI